MEQNIDQEVPLSKLEHGARVLGYLAAGASGVILIVFPPPTIVDSVWSIVSFIAGLLILGGGCAAAVASANFIYRVEYVALVAISTTVSIYTIVLWLYTLIAEKPSALFAGLLMTMLSCMLVTRFAALSRLVRAKGVAE